MEGMAGADMDTLEISLWKGACAAVPGMGHCRNRTGRIRQLSSFWENRMFALHSPDTLCPSQAKKGHHSLSCSLDTATCPTQNWHDAPQLPTQCAQNCQREARLSSGYAVSRGQARTTKALPPGRSDRTCVANSRRLSGDTGAKEDLPSRMQAKLPLPTWDEQCGQVAHPKTTAGMGPGPSTKKDRFSELSPKSFRTFGSRKTGLMGMLP